MEPTLSINVSKKQIISLLKQLDFDKRISILKEFKEDWLFNILDIKNPPPLSEDEYNFLLNEGLEDYNKGKSISHSDLKNEIEKWKKEQV